MTYFEDLSTYTYCDTDTVELNQRWLNYRPHYARIDVGWLDNPHPFATGPTPDWFPDALLNILAGPGINTMRGFHSCSLCPPATTDSMLSVDRASGLRHRLAGTHRVQGAVKAWRDVRRPVAQLELRHMSFLPPASSLHRRSTDIRPQLDDDTEPMDTES